MLLVLGRVVLLFVRILLIVVGAVICLLLLVLFLPVCYRAEFSSLPGIADSLSSDSLSEINVADGAEGLSSAPFSNEINHLEASFLKASFLARWGFGLLLFSACLEGKAAKWKLSLLGWQIAPDRVKHRGEKDEAAPPAPAIKKAGEKKQASPSSPKSGEKEKEPASYCKTGCGPQRNISQISRSQKKEENRSRKKANSMRKVSRMRNLLAALMSQEAGNAFHMLRRSIWRLAVHLFPRRLTGEITFGMEDPCYTGLILAGLGVTLPLHRNRIEVHPDLEAEQTYVRGKAAAAGRFMIGYILLILLRIYVSKEVKRTRIRLKKALSSPAADLTEQSSGNTFSV